MLVENFTNEEVLNSYSGKRVFITGHTGFKGSWLCVLMNYAGAVTKGYSLAPVYENSLFENLEKSLDIDSQIADIRDFGKLKKAILDFKPDFIFHLAAQPLVRYSYQHPLETFEVNITGTAHVLEAIRSLSHKCTAVIVTTDKVYENNEDGTAFKESDPLGGHDPYSSSKAGAEIVTQSYQRSFFQIQQFNSHQKAVATARAGNVIGGGDRATDRIIPDLVKALENNKTLDVRNPVAIRPWQHVLDPLSGYLKLGMLLNIDPHKYSGSYNFGPLEKDQCTVKEIVEMAIHQWGSGSYQTPEQFNQPHEATNLKLDITKSLTQLHWKPVWDARTAVEKTIQWYKNEKLTPGKVMKWCVGDVMEFYKN